MGLDSYLIKKTYVKNWDHTPKERRYNIEITQNNEILNTDNITYVIEEIGYWRKFNALHIYFVTHFQNGEDDCRDALVTLDDMKEFLEILNKVDKNNALCELLLPTQSGFFFGDTEYDKYYFNDVKEAIEDFTTIIESHIKDQTSNITYYYTSSW